jgi:hypothetical protein
MNEDQIDAIFTILMGYMAQYGFKELRVDLNAVPDDAIFDKTLLVEITPENQGIIIMVTNKEADAILDEDQDIN